MSRPQGFPPSRRPNPLRDLVAEKQRSAAIARERARAEQFKEDLPSMITEQVGEHMQKLETKLLKDFETLGKRAIEESTNVLTETLGDRLDSLEKVSAIQSQTLASLRDSSKVAEERVSTAVNSIEKTLSGAVPGFRLEPSAFSAPTMASPLLESAGPSAELIRPEHEPEDFEGRLYCPKCTSTRIRRANRSGMFEEMLRLFFIAPFRCRACRHKFYRF